MEARLADGPMSGRTIPGVPKGTETIALPIGDHWAHYYKRSSDGSFCYELFGALGRDPGHGGYFVPPDWI